MNYNKNLIEFFKRHNMYDEEIFNYLQKNSIMIDYNDPEQKDFVGCFYILDKNDILKDLKLSLPYVNNEKTMLISIHEITHGIENYMKIGKKFIKDITIESLPLLYEKLYIIENPSEELIKYSEYLDKLITDECDKEYKFALAIRDELIKKYTYNMKKTSKLVKKLSRKY